MTALAALISAIAVIIAALATRAISHVAREQIRLTERQHDLHLRQQRFEELRLTREIYDRRLTVYQSIKVLLSSIRPGVDISFDQISHFTKDTADSDFLFEGDEISQYISEIGLKAVELYSVEEQLKSPRDLVPAEEWTNFAQQKTELRLWLAAQPDHAKAKFKPYLTITE